MRAVLFSIFLSTSLWATVCPSKLVERVLKETQFTLSYWSRLKLEGSVRVAPSSPAASFAEDIGFPFLENPEKIAALMPEVTEDGNLVAEFDVLTYPQLLPQAQHGERPENLVIWGVLSEAGQTVPLAIIETVFYRDHKGDLKMDVGLYADPESDKVAGVSKKLLPFWARIAKSVNLPLEGLRFIADYAGRFLWARSPLFELKNVGSWWVLDTDGRRVRTWQLALNNFQRFLTAEKLADAKIEVRRNGNWTETEVQKIRNIRELASARAKKDDKNQKVWISPLMGAASDGEGSLLGKRGQWNVGAAFLLRSYEQGPGEGKVTLHWGSPVSDQAMPPYLVGLSAEGYQRFRTMTGR